MMEQMFVNAVAESSNMFSGPTKDDTDTTPRASSEADMTPRPSQTSFARKKQCGVILLDYKKESMLTVLQKDSVKWGLPKGHVESDAHLEKRAWFAGGRGRGSSGSSHWYNQNHHSSNNFKKARLSTTVVPKSEEVGYAFYYKNAVRELYEETGIQLDYFLNTILGVLHMRDKLFFVIYLETPIQLSEMRPLDKKEIIFSRWLPLAELGSFVHMYDCNSSLRNLHRILSAHQSSSSSSPSHQPTQHLSLTTILTCPAFCKEWEQTAHTTSHAPHACR